MGMCNCDSRLYRYNYSYVVTQIIVLAYIRVAQNKQTGTYQRLENDHEMQPMVGSLPTQVQNQTTPPLPPYIGYAQVPAPAAAFQQASNNVRIVNQVRS